MGSEENAVILLLIGQKVTGRCNTKSFECCFSSLSATTAGILQAG